MELHIIQIGNVLVSPDIITEEFCCDLERCKGQCCVEGDAGAPVSLDEVMAIEDALDEVWPELSASAQAVIDRQGVAYTDRDGEVILKKYSPIGEMSSFAKDYTESLFRSLGHIAVIVDRDQVVAASGVSKKELSDKPISHDLDIPKEFGLRHRAAKGISKETDALAVVVSEETGGISVAYNDSLRANLSAEDLERILMKGRF